jgi:hypothetical protein
VPFGDDLDDPYEIYTEILNKRLKFPDEFSDDKYCNAKDLISRFCRKRP